MEPDGQRALARQRRRLTASVTDLEVVRQRAFLVSLARSKSGIPEAETSLAELALLVDTAGSDPIDEELVMRAVPDPGLFIGSGKAAELAAITTAADIDVVVFDNTLSPAQQRNLQKIFQCDVVDRIAVILDIFAQHATSREGMVQVELAQLRYRLPRLRGKGTELSRLGGGIGTRGPGETKLETDRRRILDRVRKLERELVDMERSRHTRRKARKRAELPTVALVGYTNAGKSTLFNRITDAGVLVEDQLFATLDSTVRRIDLPGGQPALLSDTVGFVRRLPHELVEAFRSTLTEVVEADLLVHVVDGSDPEPDRQVAAVREVLAEIGAADVPELIVVNKEDIAEPAAISRLLNLYQGAVAVSALAGTGIDDLAGAVGSALVSQTVDIEVTVPYDRGDVVADLHRIGEVLKQQHLAEGTFLVARVPQADAGRFAEYAA